MGDQPTRSLGQWLEQACREEGLSLRQAAAKTALSHSTIADIIKGVRASAETVKKLARGFGGDGHERLALEDHLLMLAGHRTPRPNGDEPSQALSQLLDKMVHFSDHQLKVMVHFADFISGLEK